MQYRLFGDERARTGPIRMSLQASRWGASMTDLLTEVSSTSNTLDFSDEAMRP